MKYGSVVAVFLLAFAGLIHAQGAEQPNLVIIIGDDISQSDFGCYGHPRIRTPNVDRMAKEGMRFDAAFLTASSCSPTRNSILAGRYPHNTGAQHLHSQTPPGTITLPQLLKQAGYYTAAAGKWHLGPGVRAHFDRIEFSKPSGAEMWVSILQDRPKDRPFFMWFASLDAHRGWSAQTGSHGVDDVVFPPYLLERPRYRKDAVQYYNEIERLDGYVGKVRAELEKQGVSDHTLILFMADNGRPFPRCKNTCYDSGLRTPFVVYYPPLIKSNTGVPTQSLVSAIDIAPTFMELAGLDNAPSFQGVSFIPILKDPNAVIRDQVFGEKNWHDFQGHERSVRTGKYLYIRNAFPELPLTPAGDCWADGMYQEFVKMRTNRSLPPAYEWAASTSPSERLIDVENDPHQMENLAGNPEVADVLKEMRRRLDRWMDETQDSVPTDPVPDFMDRETGERLYKCSPTVFIKKHFPPQTDQ